MKNLSKHIVLLIILSFPSFLHAQYTSQEGRFEADYIKGCAPFKVTLTNLFVGATGPIQYDYDAAASGNNFVTTNEHTYTQPGTYKIAQIAPQNTSGLSDTIRIEVLDNRPPNFEVIYCSNNRVNVTITDNYYEKYLIDFNTGIYEVVGPDESTTYSYPDNSPRTIIVKGLATGSSTESEEPNLACGTGSADITPIAFILPPEIVSVQVMNETEVQLQYNTLSEVPHIVEMQVNGTGPFVNIDSLEAPDAITISGLDNENNFYCFRISALDRCEANQAYPSAILCSIRLNANAVQNQNEVRWMSGTMNLISYSVFRDNMLVANINDATVQFDDIDVNCGVTYCYTIIGYFSDGQSASQEKCVTAIADNTSPPIQNTTASFNNGSITVEFDIPAAVIADTFTITRNSTDGGQTAFIATTNSFIDSNINTSIGPYCYTIGYADACGNVSQPSMPVCPVFLSLTQQANSNVLTWTNYTGWFSGVAAYELEVLDGSGMLLATIDVTGTNTYEDPIREEVQNLRYRIRVVSADVSPLISFSNVVIVAYTYQLFFPSAFTPNQDGLNDTFEPKGRFIGTFQMKIFNRWGELIFVSNDLLEGWDGHYRGKPVTEGAYIYKVDGTDLDGTPFVKSGSLVLIRN